MSGTVRGPILAWSILLLVVLALWFGPGTLIGHRIAGVTEQIDQNTALATRYEGLNRSAAKMAEELRRLETAPPERLLLVSGASETQAAATLQEHVKKLLGESGAAVSGLQIKPSRDRGPWRVIGLAVQFTADTTGLQRAIHALESGRPLVVIETAQIRARQQTGGGLPLDVAIEVAAFAEGRTRP